MKTRHRMPGFFYVFLKFMVLFPFFQGLTDKFRGKGGVFS